MHDLPSILLAAVTGLIAGILLSIPVGPINLTIMNEGARRGFKWALLIGLGATTMEVIYCFVAFTGFASFFTRGYVKAAMELFSFVFMLFLGVKFLVAKSVQSPVHLGAAADKIETRIGERLHPHSAFMTGLVRVMGNVGVLVFWIILAASFISREWVTPDWTGKLACVGGVAAGTGGWFVGLSWLVSLGHGKLSEKALLRMERGSGIGLLVLALIHGGMIIRQMAREHMLPFPRPGFRSSVSLAPCIYSGEWLTMAFNAAPLRVIETQVWTSMRATEMSPAASPIQSPTTPSRKGKQSSNPSASPIG
jgi:threonine/homoserine/homoserine lactone efflux protein